MNKRCEIKIRQTPKVLRREFFTLYDIQYAMPVIQQTGPINLHTRAIAP